MVSRSKSSRLRAFCSFVRAIRGAASRRDALASGSRRSKAPVRHSTSDVAAAARHAAIVHVAQAGRGLCLGQGHDRARTPDLVGPGLRGLAWSPLACGDLERADLRHRAPRLPMPDIGRPRARERCRLTGELGALQILRRARRRIGIHTSTVVATRRADPAAPRHARYRDDGEVVLAARGRKPIVGLRAPSQ